MSHHVFRFAPSPNGYLHLGHAYSAILNYNMAKASGGRFLLRIEDIDRTRCKINFEQAIYEDLAWLGLEWEQPVRRQSEHFDDYANALSRLKDMGLIYPAFLSRKEIESRHALLGSDWPTDPDGAPHYPGHERHMSRNLLQSQVDKGKDNAWRLDMQKAISQVKGDLKWTEQGTGETEMVTASPSAWGDVIVARKDIPTSYHLSVVVDDAMQGISKVIRGSDLYHATSVHRLLQELLDLQTPQYHHHRLLTDLTGTKLSKSLQSKSLRELRKEGLSAIDVRELLSLQSGE